MSTSSEFNDQRCSSVGRLGSEFNNGCNVYVFTLNRNYQCQGFVLLKHSGKLVALSQLMKPKSVSHPAVRLILRFHDQSRDPGTLCGWVVWCHLLLPGQHGAFNSVRCQVRGKKTTLIFLASNRQHEISRCNQYSLARNFFLTL